jgi:hypothetical protein
MQQEVIIHLSKSSYKVHTILLNFLNKLVFSRQICNQSSNNKLHKNVPSWSRDVSDVQAYRKTHITKLIVPFRICAKTPKNSKIVLVVSFEQQGISVP